MADGFYTNDEDYPGCFGGYGSDGAEPCETATDFGGGFSGRRPAAEPETGAGGYGAGRGRRFRVFRPTSSAGCGGGYGRAA